jgi:hypothetical protein
MSPIPTFEEFWRSFLKFKAEWEEQSKKSRAEWEEQSKKSREESERKQAEWERERAASRAEWERQLAESEAKSERERAASRAEWERQLAESQAKWEKQLSESYEKSDREFAELKRLQERNEKLVGGLGNSVGELIETLVAGRLWEKFRDTPYSRLKRAYRRVQIFDDTQEIGEIDILLSDSDLCMAVEVKREPTVGDIDHHVKRMKLIKKYPPAETVGKKLVGAVAGGFVPAEVRDYAHRQGFFVLELNGESVSLAEPPEVDFTPAGRHD